MFEAAPAIIAPRSPALLGIQPSFAPDFAINCVMANKAPGVSANLSPINTTDLLLNSFSPVIADISFPAAVLTKFAFSFLVPLLANGAIEVTLSARL